MIHRLCQHAQTLHPDQHDLNDLIGYVLRAKQHHYKQQNSLKQPRKPLEREVLHASLQLHLVEYFHVFIHFLGIEKLTGSW